MTAENEWIEIRIDLLWIPDEYSTQIYSPNGNDQDDSANDVELCVIGQIPTP